MGMKSPTFLLPHRLRLQVLPLLLAPGLAFAQNLPAPAEFYFEEDRAALRELDNQRGEGDMLLNRLLRQIERDPRAWGSIARLGDIAIASGQTEKGKALYESALAGAGEQHSLSRSLRWHYGWALYRAGTPEAALEQWAPLAAGNIRGQWLPPTLALVLWRLDRRDEAVRWYAAAVRTQPEIWQSPTDLAIALPQWREEERAHLLQVHAAWAQNPPSWP